MSGEKKEELIGSNVNEIDLNLLFAESFRKIHEKFMIDILISGVKSQYFNSEINGKRNVDIINPINKKTYVVKLGMVFKLQKDNIFLFDIEFTDVTSVNTIINKNDLVIHDLRSIIKSAQNTVFELEKSVNDSGFENMKLLKDLLKESLDMCHNIRKSFLPEDIIKNEDHSIVKSYIEIPKFISTLKNIFNSINFEFMINSNGLLTDKQSECLYNCLLYIVKNYIDAGATLIHIEVSQPYNIKIIISDNRKEINLNKLDIEKSSQFFLLYNEWKTYGGTIELKSNIKKFDFILEIPPKKSNEFVLQLHHINQLFSIKNNKIILFVDDVLLNIKILWIKILKYLYPLHKYNNFPILSNDQWQNYGMFVIEFNEYTFIFASNGLYGKDIALSINCYIIITDIQMPLLNGIDMIKILLEKSYKSKILINSALPKKELESLNDIMELIKIPNISFLEKGSNINFNNFLEINY